MVTRRFLLGLALLLIVLYGGFRVSRMAYFALTADDPKGSVSYRILVMPGTPPRKIVDELRQGGVIQNADRFMRLGRILGQWSHVKAGEYLFSNGMTPIEILSILTSGVSVSYPVTIREGTNSYQIADVLERQGLTSKEQFLKEIRNRSFIDSLGLGVPNSQSLEGYLFPETYHFNRTLSSQEMARRMVKKFQSIWSSEWDTRAKQLGLSRHQIVTLASIIEKETGAPQERSMISSVFHNRLKKKMRLESDPTTIYGIWERFDGNLRKGDLRAENAYNTYFVRGLPAGPIASPGQEALKAALYPDASPYLFFVSRNDGTHVFSSTFEEHQAAVTRFQKDRRARAGKSWRDLNKGQNSSR